MTLALMLLAGAAVVGLGWGAAVLVMRSVGEALDETKNYD